MGKHKPLARIDTVIPSSGGAAIIATADDPAPPALPTIPEPTGLALSSALSRSAVTPTALIAATWAAPQLVQPQRYSIQWSTDSGFADGVTSGMDALQESATIDGLHTDTLYYMRVAAIYHAIQSGWSTAASITTADDTIPPDPVTSAAGDFTTGDLVLTWVNPTSANYKDVRVRIYASNGGTLLREVYSTVGRFAWTAAMNYLDTGGSPDPSVYVVLAARSWTNVVSTDVTVSPTKSAPVLSGSVTTNWDSDAGTAAADLVLSWTGVANVKEYVVTLDGVDHVTTDARFTYPLATNRQEHGGAPDYAVSYSVVARDALLQISGALAGTATNAAPAAANIGVAVSGFFATLTVATTVTTPIQDVDYYSIKLYKDTVLQSTSTHRAPNPVLSLSGSGTYKVGVIATDLFGRSSSEVQSSDVVIDSLTITQLRADTEYTDDLGTSPATLNSLLKDNATGAGITYSASAWHWTLAQRPLLERFRTITVNIGSGSPTGYVGVSTDGSTYSWFSGPGTVSGTQITLTAVANEAAAQSAAVNLSLYTRYDLPTVTEGRYVKLGHKIASSSYRLDEFYPRRLVQSDDIEAESIKAINIAAGTITADRLSVGQLSAITADLGTITAGTITGGTIQTATSGARVVLSSAANGGLVGYGSSDTYDPAAGTGTYQVLWKKADGKLYAGAGNVVLGSTGISLPVTTSYDALKAYKFTDSDSSENGLVAIDVASNLDVRLESYVNIGANKAASVSLAAVSGVNTQAGAIYLYAARATTEVISQELYCDDSGKWFKFVNAPVIINEGLNVGSATGAGTGEVKTSGGIHCDTISADGTGTNIFQGDVRLQNSSSVARYLRLYNANGSNETLIRDKGGPGVSVLELAPGGTSMVSISSSNMGVGMDVPSATRLAVKGIDSTSSYNAFTAQNSTPSNLMYLRNDGYSWVNQNWAVGSDAKLKNDIRDTDRGLADLLRLRPRRYARKINGREEHGFVAQELKDAFPELVSVAISDEEGTETLAVDYTSLVAVLVGAVQELSAQIGQRHQEPA